MLDHMWNTQVDGKVVVAQKKKDPVFSEGFHLCWINLMVSLMRILYAEN